MSGRIERRFTALREEKRAALVTFVCAGDPDPATAERLVLGLPAAGADLVELGMPFSDPMADGPAIQAGNLRALANGASLLATLRLATAFRAANADTPLILMGYYNPIWRMGGERFLGRAVDAGIDGLILVDLPPEEDEELCLPARRVGLDVIRLATPTTDAKRLPRVLENASGFVYYVSVAGITGQKRPDPTAVDRAVRHLRAATPLPVAVGFGVREPAQAAAIAGFADGVVVGSALVETVAAHLDDAGRAGPGLVEAVHGKVRALAGAIGATAGRTLP